MAVHGKMEMDGDLVQRRRRAMLWTHVAMAANMWGDAGHADEIGSWCRMHLGERHVAWTYRGGGRWAFPGEEEAAWFGMVGLIAWR